MTLVSVLVLIVFFLVFYAGLGGSLKENLMVLGGMLALALLIAFTR